MYVLLEKNRCRNVENDCFFLFFDYLIYIYIYICMYVYNIRDQAEAVSDSGTLYFLRIFVFSTSNKILIIRRLRLSIGF